MRRELLGLDIGGTTSAALVGTDGGTVLARRQWASRAGRGPEAMLGEIEAAARELLDEYRAVECVGVSIGGPLDCQAGVVHAPPNLPGWEAVPLRERLEAALGRPVYVEHDAAACALAEVRWGIGDELGPEPTLAYLTCGTGFGVGLVLAGKAWHGAGGRAPEIGHVRLAEEGPTAFGKQGSAEAFCAGSVLPRLAAWMFPARWTADAPDGERLAALAAAGDADASAVVARHAAMTGRVCGLLGDLLVPDAIVLGSLARYFGPGWVKAVRATWRREVLPYVAEACRLEPASLGERLQDLSALAAACGRDIGLRG
ncbi:MAG: ROK family protein [Planctomycetes bacterium]|jgi:glucokinase|nr:ROK family protein [Phycisphaerae bacterium]NBB96323.1 ROK family protein [Planctomycetota bacterium]